ncbi:non-homologous end-joining DNA ligase [Ensifer sp. NPDC090286]|uniref:non-homologous end-joining DNA ligase n=1 Tax=Ensifer sp. NPDC090286 TaxID=3363991 RepID=UPI00383A4CDE
MAKKLADPMPLRIEPCVPKLEKKPPKGAQWVHEIKWDGYRVHVHIQADQVKILTRGGYDWVKRFASIARAAQQLGSGTMIIDGEAVVLDNQGRSDFGLLQQALGGKGGTRNAGAPQLVAFDLLYLNGRDLRCLPLAERRARLEVVIRDRTGTIFLSDWLGADGEALLQVACEHGLEGIVSKRLDAPYRSDKSGDWIKVKCAQRSKFFIVGFERSIALPSHISKLLLAALRDGGLVYVGSVGTGWSNSTSLALRELLELIKTTKPAIALKRKGAVFTEPRFAVEVEYRAWTEDNKLRHPSFKGIEEATAETAVYQLDAQATK